MFQLKQQKYKMKNEASNNNEALNKALVTSSAAKGMKTELIARMMVLGLPNDDYKKGFNDALEWAVRLVDRYEKGDGLFQ